MTSAIAASTPLITTLLWVVTLTVSPGSLAPGSVLLTGVGLIGLATTAVIGTIITRGRWAWRLSLVVLVLGGVLAVVTPVSTLWAVSLAVTGLSLVAMMSPPVTGSLRQRPPATGPPVRAVIVPLILIGIPFLLGLAAADTPSWATMVVGLTAPVCALWYARVLPLGLLAIRVLWPLLAIGLAFAQEVRPAVVSAVAGGVIALLSWHPSVKVAFHPPRETGTSLPIPPELTPREVLDTARLDDRGRPLQ